MSAIRIRAARFEEIPALEDLIVRSARLLSKGFYSEAEAEAAITHVFGVDSDLVGDGTYLVAEHEDGILLGCGGWSRRETLFGGDNFAARQAGFLDPARDAARIRAFFVDPGAARGGVGTAILTACEDGARAAGFTRTALMATLPGVPFYSRFGYVPDGDEIDYDCGGVPVRFQPMAKVLPAL